MGTTTPFATVTAVAATFVTLLVVAARIVAEPFWGTSYVVLAAMLACAGALVATYLRLEPGWIAWRRAVAALTFAAIAYPGLWAAAAIADAHLPGTVVTWLFAVLAGTWHLPMIGAFSLLPLLAVRYLGTGSSTLVAGLVTGLGVLTIISFVLFFGDFEPFAADALIEWAPGATVGLALNLLYLSTVLLGPIVALLASRHTDGEASGRLVLVGLSALAGSALVMLCGALGTFLGVGTVALFAALYAALAILAVGCSQALATPTAAIEHRPRLAALTERESEVLGLLAQGLSNSGIAARLVLSERTVDAHLRSIFTKLALPDSRLVNRRVHAVNAWNHAQEEGLKAS